MLLPQIISVTCQRHHLNTLNQALTVLLSLSELRLCLLANALLSVPLDVFRVLNPLTLNFINE